jgi:UDP-N-acetylmuramate--alanine ligase
MNYKKRKMKGLVHFIGIGGIGMSGIAELMLNLGYKIQGSDVSKNNNVERLQKKNIKVFLNHKSSNINNASVVVYSSAIKKNNPEIIAAKKKLIPIVIRADMLGELMRSKHSIAIAGSHGKTTTTSLVGSVLQGGKIDPTIINGGIINAFSSNSRHGLGKWMVVEADESDGTFLRLPHEINIITNIDSEHLDYYKNFDNLMTCFKEFATNIPFYGVSIICLENKNSKNLANKIDTRKVITYGINKINADLNITSIKTIKNYSIFSIKVRKNIFNNCHGSYKFTVNLLGEHNILNAAAAVGVGFFLNLSTNQIKKGLKIFQGVNRRFTFLGKINNAFVYDDYAHHPTEIKATLEIVKFLKKNKIIVIFQPHRFSRTKDLYLEFVKSFKNIDYLFISDIYPAGEKPIKGINSQKLVKDISYYRTMKVNYLKNPNKLHVILSPFYKKENLIIFMGAGSISKWAHNIIEKKSDKKI